MQWRKKILMFIWILQMQRLRKLDLYSLCSAVTPFLGHNAYTQYTDVACSVVCMSVRMWVESHGCGVQKWLNPQRCHL